MNLVDNILNLYLKNSLILGFVLILATFGTNEEK